MKKILILMVAAVMAACCSQSKCESTTEQLPWENGNLCVSENGRFLQHENGVPFFWLGETGWLLPERLTREEADFYLDACKTAGYNVVQVQTVNGVPATNAYGKLSHPAGYDFSVIEAEGENGYWQNMDYLIGKAEQNGIYIGMVCIWGGLVKKGLMNQEEAVAYGEFLANRYKDQPNIIWMIGGDIKGDVETEVWETLARTIKSIDQNHLMTFHSFGRTSSTRWFHNAEWLDFNMFQSGHRRYDQTRGDGDDTAQASVAEDNWLYVEEGLSREPQKPILDGEPSYEEIPQGLHDPSEPWWKSYDVRRYAYWSVFAGAFGHTYGHNSIMQMHPGGEKPGGYGAIKSWKEGLQDPGFSQMQWLKKLIVRFPFFERVGDQSVIAGENGFRYDRVIATRGEDYLLAYTYTNKAFTLDLTKIAGEKKQIWWMNPADGKLTYAGELENGTHTFHGEGEEGPANDRVLIAFDAAKSYIGAEEQSL